MRSMRFTLTVTLLSLFSLNALAEPSRLFVTETSQMPRAGAFNIDLVNTYDDWISDDSMQMRIGLKKGEFQVIPIKSEFASAALGYKYPLNKNLFTYVAFGLNNDIQNPNDIKAGGGYTLYEDQLLVGADVYYLYENEISVINSNISAFYKLKQSKKNSRLLSMLGGEIHLHNRPGYATGVSIGARLKPARKVTLDILLLQQLPMIDGASVIATPAAVRLNIDI